MATGVKTEEGKVAGALDRTNLLAIAAELEVLKRKRSEVLLARPLKGLAPGLVTEPVADEIGITSVDEDRDLLKNAGNEAVERLHPVTLEQEVAVDVEVAAVVAGDLGTNSLHDVGLVEVLGDPAKLSVAEVAAVLALATDIIDVLTSALVRSQQGVVAVDGGRDTGPDALRVVAALNQIGAARVGVVHSLTLALAEDGRPATITAGHGPVVLVLGQAIGETVTNEHRLEVDVALLVGENLRSEDGNVVAGVGFTSNVEVLLGILGELLEEEGEQGVNVLAGGDRVADGTATVRVADVDGLVKEDDRGVGVP